MTHTFCDSIQFSRGFSALVVKEYAYIHWSKMLRYVAELVKWCRYGLE